MQRSIKFSQFRNIGLEKEEYLILNHSFEKGKLGNLVILIGPNNSGKSNVLDGIKATNQNGKIRTRDITNLYYEDKYRHPSVSLVYRDDNNHFVLEKGLNNSAEWKIIKTDEQPVVKKPSVSIAKNEFIQIYNFASRFGVPTSSSNTYQRIVNNTIEEDKMVDAILTSLTDIYNTLSRMGYGAHWSELMGRNFAILEYWNSNRRDNNAVEAILKNKFGVDATPRVVEYAETPISSNNLSVDNVDQLSGNTFFISLFGLLKVEISEIVNAYRDFSATNNKAVLNKLSKKMQPKMEKLNDRFNRMYFASDDKYKFTLDFESSRIFFSMARGKGEDAIQLEYQSTGFKWFFNFFFNFISANKLKAGDIVIMDEPATNLHPQGQVELRKFIKEFAIANDVLFVIATHSPFLIDVDHYDELRVISMSDNRSKIDNHFTAVNADDPDSLLPIKESLTIKQNVLYDLDTEVVWVEGITDYNSLTMFKNLFGCKNISFLPFNGVGTNKEQTKEILGKLLKIKFHKRSLLVDADKAGRDMFNQAKDSGFDSVHTLSEVSIGEKPAMMIEDLFSAEDKKKYPAILSKSGGGTSIMKDHCALSDFTKATIENFKKVFELLEDN